MYTAAIFCTYVIADGAAIHIESADVNKYATTVSCFIATDVTAVYDQGSAIQSDPTAIFCIVTAGDLTGLIRRRIFDRQTAGNNDDAPSDLSFFIFQATVKCVPGKIDRDLLIFRHY